MQRINPRFILLLFSLNIIQISYAQNTVRPKIGLTLSGGGAKGLAHIGILQAIDSAGLKIDYITGTSMGSIMGGLYAAGYSGDSIEAISRDIDWELVFSTSPSLDNISIEEKPEYDNYLLEIPRENGKFKIGKGIIEGQELWLKFSDVLEPVYNITDFSKLSIPFKCIGTDLSTGNAVEMDHGNLVTALRASMAIPSVFTPVKYDGKTLVDGGVVNNFPVLNVKNMGADYVIGVNVSGPLHNADSLATALDILLQIGFFKDAAGFQMHRAKCDLYITPDLKTYSTGSFGFADSIIDLGIKTGREYYPYFKKLADSLNAIYPSTFVKDRIPKNKKISITKFSIEGLNNTSEAFFFGLLNLEPGRAYSHKEMSTAIRRVYGSRYYKIINYDFIPIDSVNTEMHFRVQEFPLSSFKFAINYTNFTKIGLKLNLTSRDLLFKESRAMATFELSENPRGYAEYYRFLSKHRNLRLNLSAYGESVDFPVYQNYRLYETLRSGYLSMKLALEYNLNISSYLGIGQERIYSAINTLESPELVYDGNNNYWYSNISYILNTLNKKFFATSGWKVKAEAGYVYSQDPDFEIRYQGESLSSSHFNFNYDAYFKLYFDGSHLYEINPRLAFKQRITGGLIPQNNNTYIANQFLVGGVNELIRNQIPFMGLDESELKTESTVVLQLALQYNIFKKSFLTATVNGAGISNDYVNQTSDDYISGYGLTFGYDSPIGPIELTGMYCDQDGMVRTNIRLGYIF
jgi:NTE family protein